MDTESQRRFRIPLACVRSLFKRSDIPSLLVFGLRTAAEALERFPSNKEPKSYSKEFQVNNTAERSSTDLSTAVWVTPRSAERFPNVYWDRVHLGEMKQTRDI